VRLNADRGEHAVEPLGDADARFEIRRAFTGADRHHPFDACLLRAINDGVEVLGEFRIVQVAVRIHQDPHYFNRAPTGTSSRKPASVGLPPSSDAATIMPCDSMPFNLRGARLATITTLRPSILLGLVGFGDPGDDGARRWLADVDLHVQEFVGPLHFFGREHLADAQLDLHEVIMAM
jgi:hypothetical protein